METKKIYYVTTVSSVYNTYKIEAMSHDEAQSRVSGGEGVSVGNHSYEKIPNRNVVAVSEENS